MLFDTTKKKKNQRLEFQEYHKTESLESGVMEQNRVTDSERKKQTILGFD